MTTTVDYRSDPTATRLHAVLRRWLLENPGWAVELRDSQHVYRSADQIASALLADAEFAELRLSDLLHGPDGQLIETVVTWLLPYPASAELRLFVDAVTIAAAARQRNQRGVAALATVFAAVVLGLMVD